MPLSQSSAVLTALQAFARDVKHHTDLAIAINAHPEDQLKGAVKTLVIAVGKTLGRNVDILSESPIDDVGRPDLAIAVDGLLTGYIELKAPGEGTTERELSPANRLQLKRFRSIPNLIYTDARDWTFYLGGARQHGHELRMGAIDESGDNELTEADAATLLAMLRLFLRWEPIVPKNPRALAELLAPLTRMLRDDVATGVVKSNSALANIYDDWKRTLFPDASEEEFADSYAQTVTYGLLLAKLDGATVRDTQEAARAIAHHSSLLSRTLEILTQEGTREELGVGLQLLERTIEAVNSNALQPKTGDDPWLYFYEDFLAVYDPKLRNERGVYYTPAQVVKAQVTLVDELLRTKLGIPDGVAGNEVTVLDPAAGTGTYLLQVLQQGIDNVAKRIGPGAVSGVATQMARNLYGFELLVGPYAVAHLRLTQAIHAEGGREPNDGVHVFLTDTLESPNQVASLPHSQYERPLAEEHRKAREVKNKTRILVCIGNPPYEREQSDTGEEHQMGRWIRFGHALADGTVARPLLRDFIDPAQAAGAGVHIKNLYNLYVYFWRWALWKVFDTQNGPGIVSFITASSYLRGPGFAGMWEEMRRTFDELWVIDLEGDSRGTRTSENVFDIRTPVAIAVGVRYGPPNRDQPATVHYAKVTGSREDKYLTLDNLTGFNDLNWLPCGSSWLDSFLPPSSGDYFDFPALSELMPWLQSGVKAGRSWVIAEEREVLQRRTARLTSSQLTDRRALFKDSPTGRKVSDSVATRLGPEPNLRSMTTVNSHTDLAPPVRYGFRPFDRHWIVPDYRLIDRPGPSLWQSVSINQLFAISLSEHSLGHGPAVLSSALIPDLHHFRGSFGGKDIVPLYRDSAAQQPNITKGLLDILSTTPSADLIPEDLLAYIVGVLAHPGYTERFHDELEVPGPRVPLTKDPALFQRAVDLGKQVIAWQTYAERFPDAIGSTKGRVPSGAARLETAIPDDPLNYPHNLNDVSYNGLSRELRVGEGLINNVDPRIWSYQVSGLRVVRSWLGYRMKERSGRKSSALDDIRPERWTLEMTNELMELLWVLEGVIALEPAQDALLAEIVAGPLFLAAELPTPTDAERQPPRTGRAGQTGFGGEFGA